MVNKDKELILKVQELSDKGVGISYYQDKQIYTQNTLVGETIKVKLKDSFAKGSKRYDSSLIEIIQKSSDRVSVSCPYYINCGACHLMHMSTSAQAIYKSFLIDNALCSIGINFTQDKFVYISKTYIARYKSIRNYAYIDGQIISGFYQNYTHSLVKIDDCLLEDSLFSKLTLSLDKLFNCYSEFLLIDNSLIIKNLMLRSASNQIMLVLVVTKDLLQIVKNELKTWSKEHNITSFNLSIKKDIGNKILGDRSYVLYGKDSIEANFLDFKFILKANSFLQVNYAIAAKLYKRAIEFCASGNTNLALDLCCGVGTMTLGLSRYFKQVIGVEIVAEAIECANENKLLNKVENVEFIAADVKDVINSLTKEKIDAIIADPSRVGLGTNVIKAISKIKGPLKLALISCSLKGLRRDLKDLLDCGFKIEAVQGYDMFVHSTHVETLVLLSK